jgi:hypothetical protein
MMSVRIMTDETDHAHMVKIWFVLDPKRWHRHSSESLWAEPLAHTPSGGVFRLANSPLHVDNVSYRDMVHATRDTDGRLIFDHVVKRSGHSTYMALVPPDSSSFQEYWKKLESLGCSYEWGEQNTSMGKRNLYSIDVPETANLGAVVGVLDDGEKQGVWIYQEGHNARTMP